MSTEVIIFSSLIGLFVVLGLIISIVVYFYYKRKRERYKYWRFFTWKITFLFSIILHPKVYNLNHDADDGRNVFNGVQTGNF